VAVLCMLDRTTNSQHANNDVWNYLLNLWMKQLGSIGCHWGRGRGRCRQNAGRGPPCRRPSNKLNLPSDLHMDFAVSAISRDIFMQHDLIAFRAVGIRQI